MFVINYEIHHTIRVQSVRCLHPFPDSILLPKHETMYVHTYTDIQKVIEPSDMKLFYC